MPIEAEPRLAQASKISEQAEQQLMIEAEKRLAKATKAAEERVAQAAIDAEHRVTLAALNAGRIAQQISLLANQPVEQIDEGMKNMEGKVTRQQTSPHKFCDRLYMVLRGTLLSFYKVLSSIILLNLISL